MFKMLDILQHSEELLSLADLAKKLDMSISGARKLLAPLIDKEYVTMVPKGRGGVFYKANHKPEENHIYIKWEE